LVVGGWWLVVGGWWLVAGVPDIAVPIPETVLFPVRDFNAFLKLAHSLACLG
jgi:hypothetical protein